MANKTKTPDNKEDDLDVKERVVFALTSKSSLIAIFSLLGLIILLLFVLILVGKVDVEGGKEGLKISTQMSKKQQSDLIHFSIINELAIVKKVYIPVFPDASGKNLTLSQREGITRKFSTKLSEVYKCKVISDLSILNLEDDADFSLLHGTIQSFQDETKANNGLISITLTLTDKDETNIWIASNTITSDSYKKIKKTQTTKFIQAVELMEFLSTQIVLNIKSLTSS